MWAIVAIYRIDGEFWSPFFALDYRCLASGTGPLRVWRPADQNTPGSGEHDGRLHIGDLWIRQSFDDIFWLLLAYKPAIDISGQSRNWTQR